MFYSNGMVPAWEMSVLYAPSYLWTFLIPEIRDTSNTFNLCTISQLRDILSYGVQYPNITTRLTAKSGHTKPPISIPIWSLPEGLWPIQGENKISFFYKGIEVTTDADNARKVHKHHPV